MEEKQKNDGIVCQVCRSRGGGLGWCVMAESSDDVPVSRRLGRTGRHNAVRIERLAFFFDCFAQILIRACLV